MTTRTFGRRLDAAQHHDPRSRMFPAGISPLRSVVHKLSGPVLNQRATGSCTGHATAGALNCGTWRGKRRLLTNKDALAIYTIATRLDPYPGWMPETDTGSDGLSAAKAAVKLGHLRSYQHCFGLAHVLGTLVNTPLIVGTKWTTGMSDVGKDGFVKLTGEVEGGHEWAVIGLNVEKRYVIGLNSWGPSFGVNGRFFVPFDVFGALLDEGGDATVLVR